MRKQIAFTVFLIQLLVSSQTFSAETTFDQSHEKWSRFLQKHVVMHQHTSAVKYKSIKSAPGDLQEYLNSLESVTKKEFGRFAENEKLAFLINAYNAFTIKLIIDHYPIKTIKDAGERSLANPTASPWKTKFFKLLEEERYLDNIEHELIRKSFNEPRIHFALVCASIGCPALRNEAYTAAQLDSQLEDASTNFLSDQSRNHFISNGNKLEISSIFKWYGDDFRKKYGSLENFIGPRISSIPEQQKLITTTKVIINFQDYNWSLNDEK
jgi:hypothetical protein